MRADVDDKTQKRGNRMKKTQTDLVGIPVLRTIKQEEKLRRKLSYTLKSKAAELGQARARAAVKIKDPIKTVNNGPSSATNGVAVS